jgi:acyl-CoA thioesterase
MDNFIKKVKNDPYAKFLGINIDKTEEGYALCSVIITKDMLNFLGVIHGGLVFSLSDVAFSVASNNNNPPSFALDISGSFLKSVKVGDIISAEAKLIHTTKRTGLYRMDVFNNKELLATFNGTVFRKLK